MVRGDQQKPSEQETYVVTLAARSFRTLMAIMARFNLDSIQFNVVNAFPYATFNKVVYIQIPIGYRIPSRILRVNKVLYGLRRLLLLWQKNFTTTLQRLGFEVILHEPCIIIKGGILVFFFVDNTVFGFRKEDTAIVRSLVL